MTNRVKRTFVGHLRNAGTRRAYFPDRLGIHTVAQQELGDQRQHALTFFGVILVNDIACPRQHAPAAGKAGCA